MKFSAPPSPKTSRWSDWLLLIALLALIVASFVTLSLEWGMLFSVDTVRSMLEFLQGFAPPDLSFPFLQRVAVATLETLAMSAVGTLIAAVLGLVLALPASGRLGRITRSVTRWILNFSRSIPELVWAALLLIAAGLGPLAGTLALAAHTSGVLGRLFAETLENAAPQPEAALRMNGAPAISAFLYATLPQALPQMVSYTLYRWENNIRAAAVLGVVGAGGLGQMLKYHLSLFHMQQAATVLIAMLLLVILVDGLSLALRRVLTR
jgi:phosphonate transport system permease protein